MLRFIALALLLNFATAALSSYLPEPSLKDIRYSDEYKRSVMDIWLTNTSQPAPVLVYFHGGGFKGGDKTRIHQKKIYNNVTDLGVVLVSVNYPFIHQLGYEEPYDASNPAPIEFYHVVIREAYKSIVYLKKNANKYGINPDKVMISGSSAGATIAEVIGLSLDNSVIGILPTAHPSKSTAQIISLIDQNDPPMVIWSRSGPKDKIHHPKGSKQLYDACIDRGLDCDLFGIPRRNGLPALPRGKTPVDVLFEKVLR